MGCNCCMSKDQRVSASLREITMVDLDNENNSFDEIVTYKYLSFNQH